MIVFMKGFGSVASSIFLLENCVCYVDVCIFIE